MIGSAEYGSIGPYKIVRRLGFGRKSEVLLATRLFPGNFERSVVIKRLLAPCEDDPERQAILATEALAYSRLAHPAIVQLFDFFSHEGHLALVLEYVDGLPLARLLERTRARREPLGDRVALFVASRVFAALAAVHSARDPQTGETTPIVHRDVSPDNVLVPWDGFVKLGDFDLAKVSGVSGDTASGLMKGTYGYMAPEQVIGDAVTPRTDVYAGCLLLRELLLARPNFDARLPELELLGAMAEPELPPVESLRAGIPRRLADALRRGLQREPNARSLTAAEMVDVLRAQTDMEVAHGELIAILQRLRQSEARASQPPQRQPTPVTGIGVTNPPSSRWSFHTPKTMNVARTESVPPIENGPSSPIPPHAHRLLPVVAFLTGVATLALAYAVGRTLSAPAMSEVEAAAAPPAASSAPSQVALPPAASAPPGTEPVPSVTVAPATGALLTPASARKHRVWIDGQLAAWASGGVIHLSCGPHVVRIGSAGTSQSIHVPCGGEVVVDTK
jgi:serine/threonine protein kinase